MPAKYQNANITNELLNNHNTLQDFLLLLYFGQEGMDKPENLSAVSKFKKKLAQDRLPMLNFNDLDKMYKDSIIEGEEENLKPNNDNEEQ